MTSMMTKVTLCLVFVCWAFSSVWAINHGTNLIWAQGPHGHHLSLSRLVGISGDPDNWVHTKEPNVNFIAAPHFSWVFSSLGFHWDDQCLYWSETMHKKIQRLALNGSTETRALFIGSSPEVNGMTVDWFSRNLYFTDALYDWIMMIPSRSHKASYRIVVSKNLTSPHGIVVHPMAGRLFWSDWGAAPKIESSDLLGQDRKVLLQTNDLVSPKGLALDFHSDRLFWVDSSKSTIESMGLDGSHRKLFRTNEKKSSFFGLAIYGNFFFVTDRGNEGVLKVFSIKESVVNFKLNYLPYDIVMYDQSRQPGNSTECDEAECEQMCVLDPAKGAMCVCGEEYHLNTTDNTTCIPSKTFVHPSHIYTIGDSICQYPANMADMSLRSLNLDSQCFLEERQGYMTLAFDARKNLLYYFANRTKTISRIPLEAKGVGKVLTGGDGIVNGMSYDWVHDNLYWADTTNGIIYVCSKDCNFQTAVLERLAQPFAITVHPARGKIYWTSHGHLPDVAPSVETSYMDGSQREVIMGDNLVKPMHMFMDYHQDVLYWADSGMNHIRKYDLNTKRITVFFQLPGVTFYGISIFKDYFLWTDRKDQNGMHAARLDRKEKVRGIIHPRDGIASDLITFDPHNQPVKNDTFINPCSQIYLKQGNEGYRCACSNGYVPDNISPNDCETNPVKDNFLLVNDAYQRQVFQVDVQTGVVSTVTNKQSFEPVALTWDPFNYEVFWSDNKDNLIKSQKMNDRSTTTTALLLSKVSVCDGLAADYVNRLLFFSDSGTKLIGVAGMDSGLQWTRAIIDNDLEAPRDLVISPNQGLLYWSDWGTKNPRIEKAFMDGSGRDIIVKFNTTAWPNGLALDVEDNLLYWADAFADSISVVNLETREITVIIEEPGSHYFSMVLMADYLYVSDWTRNYLVRINKRGGTMKRFGNGRFTKLYGIVGFNSSEMYQDVGPCKDNTCHHLCLPSGKDTYSCRCDALYDLIDNVCVLSPSKTTTELPQTVLMGNETSVDSVSLKYPSTSSYTQYPLPLSTTRLPPLSSSSSGSLSSSSAAPPPSSSSSTTESTRHKSTTFHAQATIHPSVVVSDSSTGRASMVTGSTTRHSVSTPPTEGKDTTITYHTKRPTAASTAITKPMVEKSTEKSDDGLSPAELVAIVGSIALVIVLALVVAAVFRRRQARRVGHWKLQGDRSFSDSVYHDAHSDSVGFESGIGIANPTYDYLHNLPSMTNDDMGQDDLGLDS